MGTNRLTRAALKDKIDQLGALRAEQAALDASERDLSLQVREALQAAKLDSLEAAQYSAVLAERSSLVLDVAKFRKRAGEAVFLRCCRIDGREARRHFRDDQLERMGAVEMTTTLRISRLASQ